MAAMAGQKLRAAIARRWLCQGGVPPWLGDIPPEQLLQSATVMEEKEEEEEATAAKRAPEEGSVLLFPGQGSQYVGMGRELLRYSAARELFRVAERVLGYDLLGLCSSGPRAELDRTVRSQPAVFVCSLAAVEKLHHQQPAVIENCVAAAGFSIGEYAALVFAGAIEYAEALYAVKVRAEAMQEASETVPSGMLSVIGQHNSDYVAACIDARKHCKSVGIEDPICEVSNYLFPDSRVIAGHLQALEFLQQNSKKYSFARVKMLPVSGAFHTRLMEPVVEPLSEALQLISIQKPLIPVYSNVTSQRYTQPKQIKHLLAKQLISPVKWEQTMHAIYERKKGVRFPFTYEMGPGRQLGAILRNCNMRAWKFYKNIDALGEDEKEEI
ncbi:PREDICTED: malonyl-CoA-acyl carrier protein transacylase, mitochondrial [Gekko japonicus]|uniref:Malonyl-CoA-acyl carrier protein transacylase, mitochondrial n=1 Tax=Gekko japonicus TaxID=146911 RepID=A0ABM1KXM8_GEKJA|nr:PREDICTED: malonyl-CoA-acyl carrier protein transacylase, mitochondrial [Gekko japonicus]